MKAISARILLINAALVIAAAFSGYPTASEASIDDGRIGPSPTRRHVPADFNGNGRTGYVLFRNAVDPGAWWFRGSQTRVLWGIAGDVPVPADYDGDGQSNIAIYRSNGYFMIRGSCFTCAYYVYFEPEGTSQIPLAGDFNGDGREDPCIFRASATTGTWEARTLSGQLIFEDLQWGLLGDIPVPGDFDGDGWTDIAVYRPAEQDWWIRYSQGGTDVIHWGEPGAIPVVGDFDGDGRSDIATFHQDGLWWVRLAAGGAYVDQWGIGQPASRDDIVPGDYDGDGTTDLAIYREPFGESFGQWWIKYSSGLPAFDVTTWGRPDLDDVPVNVVRIP